MNKELETLTRILSIKELLFHEIGKVFESEGLSYNELMIIYIIQHKQKEFRAGDLAAALQMPMSTLTGIIDRMIEKGLVLRKHSNEDKRVVIIELNPEFKERSEHYMKDLANLLKEISGTFTEEWLKDFNDKLKSYKEVLENRVQ